MGTDKKERDLLALDKELDRHNKELQSKLTTDEIERLKLLNRELNQRTAKNCWSKRGVDDMDSKVDELTHAGVLGYHEILDGMEKNRMDITPALKLKIRISRT